jgi:hypothetical protein
MLSQPIALAIYRRRRGRLRELIRFSCTLIVFFCWPCARLLAEPPSLHRWELRYPTTPDLREIVFANGVFVGLPALDLGAPFTSSDGHVWTHATVQSETWGSGLTDIAFGDGNFYAATGAGEILRSADSARWGTLSFTPVSGGSTNRNIQVAAGNGILVTTSEEGGVAASSDGLIWTEAQALAGCPRRLWFGNGVFLAVVHCQPGGAAAIWTSADGLNWTTQTEPASFEVLDVTFSAGIFTAVSWDYELWTSEDGRTWSNWGVIPLGNDPVPDYFVLGNGRFVGLSLAPGRETDVITSNDGITWTTTASVHQPKGLVFGNGRFVISGVDTLVSSDGLTWTAQYGAPEAMPLSVAFGNGLFVAVGGPTMLISPDGETWERVQRPARSRLPVGVYFVGGMFIGPSWPEFDDASEEVQAGYLMTSRDGLNWTEHRGPPFTSSLRSIAFGAGRYVAIGDGNRLYSSSNGIDWREALETEFLSHVLYGNGLFVASGHMRTQSGQYHSFTYGSPDGVNWRTLATLEGRLVMLATYGAGVFVAQTLDAPRRHVLTSPDGVHWTIVYTGRNPGLATAAYSTYTSGYFVILSPYTILSSPDAVNWSEQSADAALTIADITMHPALASGRGTLVTISRGTIQQSGLILPPFTVTVFASPPESTDSGFEAGWFDIVRGGSANNQIGIPVSLRLTGAAENGVDYTSIPELVVIPAGQSRISIPVTPTWSGLETGAKTVTVTAVAGEAYDVLPPSSATVTLKLAGTPPPTQATVDRDEDGAVRLCILSVPGTHYVLEGSDNLAVWETVATGVTARSLTEIEDPLRDSPRRFYRIRSSPTGRGAQPATP